MGQVCPYHLPPPPSRRSLLLLPSPPSGLEVRTVAWTKPPQDKGTRVPRAKVRPGPTSRLLVPASPGPWVDGSAGVGYGQDAGVGRGG